MGRFSKFEEDLVEGIVLNSPGGLSSAEVTALARVLRRPKSAVKAAVENAREMLAESAGEYAAIHKAAVMAAYDRGDNETALKGSQWALTNISHEGARIIDKATGEAAGTKVMIGIQMGSMTPSVKVEEA